MRTGATSGLVALDGGTTTTRARLVVDGRIAAVSRRPVGVRGEVLGQGARPLVEAVRGAIWEVVRAGGGLPPDRVVASGMLSSEAGLAHVPHVLAPAGFDELALGMVSVELPEVWSGPIDVVPGVRTPAAPGPDGWASADVMRGEECETLGALRILSETGHIPAEGLRDGTVFVWPGSHTKLVEVDGEGRIARSFTTLAGELMQAVASHTLLSASLPHPWPEQLIPDASDAGLRLSLEQGLGRAAFLVRIAHLSGSLEADARASFWIGAVVGDDADRLGRHELLAGKRPIWVGGRASLRGLYARRLAEFFPGRVSALDEETADAAAAIGAAAVSARARTLSSG